MYTCIHVRAEEHPSLIVCKYRMSEWYNLVFMTQLTLALMLMPITWRKGCLPFLDEKKNTEMSLRLSPTPSEVDNQDTGWTTCFTPPLSLGMCGATALSVIANATAGVSIRVQHTPFLNIQNINHIHIIYEYNIVNRSAN